MFNKKSVFSLSLLVLLFGIVSRAAFLEYLELVDPTESRYAVVAQTMAMSGDWLTPKLPLPEGEIPYLGKPPLHFWLTALSYKIFGINEWTSRLPSFLGACLLLLLMFRFVRETFSAEIAHKSCLILFSSTLFFFLAGASVTDLTLTLMISAGIMFLYRAIFTDNSAESPKNSLLAALFGGLAFMIKGPIGVVLIFLPFVLWSALNKNLGWFKKVSWIKAAIIFLVLTAPWFILGEISNPGLTKYFFWNENIARYLFKNYGDRYGSGHVEPYFMAWLMLAIGFLPWTVFLLLSLRKEWTKSILKFNKTEPRTFILLWAISTPLFFSFVRQLHAMYVLPALPPFAILTAISLNRSQLLSNIRIRNLDNNLVSNIILIIGLIFSAVGACLRFSWLGLVLSLIVSFGAYYIKRSAPSENSELGIVKQTALVVFLLFAIAISSLAPYINQRRSSEGALEQLIETGKCSGEDQFTLGVASRNSYSHYWTARNWEEELTAHIDIKYSNPAKLSEGNIPCHYIYKANDLDDVPEEIQQYYKLVGTYGSWFIFKRLN